MNINSRSAEITYTVLQLLPSNRISTHAQLDHRFLASQPTRGALRSSSGDCGWCFFVATSEHRRVPGYNARDGADQYDRAIVIARGSREADYFPGRASNQRASSPGKTSLDFKIWYVTSRRHV